MAEKPVVAGKLPIVEKTEPGTYWWCACGRSSKQPFCDGSHAGTGIEPKEIKIESIYLGIVPFVSLQLVGLILVIVFPQIALWLPKVVHGL